MHIGDGAAKEVWAFDFDGVVCDSVGESSLSAWRAATIKWPELFKTPEAEAQQDRVIEGMRAVRPVVETGCVRCTKYMTGLHLVYILTQSACR